MSRRLWLTLGQLIAVQVLILIAGATGAAIIQSVGRRFQEDGAVIGGMLKFVYE